MPAAQWGALPAPKSTQAVGLERLHPPRRPPSFHTRHLVRDQHRNVVLGGNAAQQGGALEEEVRLGSGTLCEVAAEQGRDAVDDQNLDWGRGLPGSRS